MSSQSENTPQIALPSRDLMQEFIDATVNGNSHPIGFLDSILSHSPETNTGAGFLSVAKTVNGNRYKISVAPAAIKRGKKAVPVLPSHRENLVEKALRQIARDRPRPATEADIGWIDFTLNELCCMLNELGHVFEIEELEEALQVLNGAAISVSFESDRMEQGYAVCGVLEEIVWRRRKSGDADGRHYRIRARFQSLVTALAGSPPLL